MKTKILSFAAFFLTLNNCQASVSADDYLGSSPLKITEINRSWWGPTVNIEVSEWKGVEDLYLGNNQLKLLPTEIGELKNLKQLYLENNRLTSLPASIRKLENSLTTLYLAGNPLQERGENGTLGWRDLKEIFGNKMYFNPPQNQLTPQGQ